MNIFQIKCVDKGKSVVTLVKINCSFFFVVYKVGPRIELLNYISLYSHPYGGHLGSLI